MSANVGQHMTEALGSQGFMCFLVSSAGLGGYWLRRILRRVFDAKCAGFCAASYGSLKVGFRGHQLVFQGNPGSVSQPCCYSMDGIFCYQLCFPRRPQGMKQSWPSCQPSPFDDLGKPAAETAIHSPGFAHREAPERLDTIHVAHLGLVERFFEDRPRCPENAGGGWLALGRNAREPSAVQASE